MNSLFIITSDSELQRRLTDFFSLDGYNVTTADSVADARSSLDKAVFDVAVIDIDEETDIAALRRVLVDSSETMTILSYSHEKSGLAISLVNSGAYESISKPYKIGTLYNKVEKAVRFKMLKLETQNLRGERDLIYWSGDLVGHSPPFQEVLRQVHKVAKSDSSIMLLGESGTGKEVMAGVVHYNSLRSKNAFVRVNCAALHEDLLETELFGHEKGAFTGAINSRVGRFEHANGGTIFLDEIADMSLKTQAKVLRVLQEREFERVGSNRVIKVDVRVISATNKDLADEMKEGRFREDLFYRLNVVSIELPPLRDRISDIMPLARYFLGKIAASMNREISGFEDKAEQALETHIWPGNIRELRNSIERAILFADQEYITIQDLDLKHGRKELEGSENSASRLSIPESGIELETVERDLVIQALDQSEWVQKRAAELLGISPRVLNYKIKRFSITHEKWIVNS